MDVATLWAATRTLKAPLTLVHFSRRRYKLVRPLNYWELFQDRQRGRWKGKPKMAFWYVIRRAQLEQDLRDYLKRKGILHPRELSFLYATILGKEKFGGPGDWRHEVPLTPERIGRSFFDVVGLPKEMDSEDLDDWFGERGLNRSLRLWAEHQAILKVHTYMGMKIFPRIEVITIDPIVPAHVTRV